MYYCHEMDAAQIQQWSEGLCELASVLARQGRGFEADAGILATIVREMLSEDPTKNRAMSWSNRLQGVAAHLEPELPATATFLRDVAKSIAVQSERCRATGEHAVPDEVDPNAVTQPFMRKSLDNGSGDR
jgi:hypothetical protein